MIDDRWVKLVDLASEFKLPLFLHSRTSEAHIDLVRILREHPKPLLPPRRRGVVHSFTGTRDEMEELISLGYSIGLNGWFVSSIGSWLTISSLSCLT